MNNLVSNDLNSQTWLRKWEVLIDNSDEGSSKTTRIDISALRCVFTIKVQRDGRKYCALQIFNMKPSTESLILKKGLNIKISAGYQTSRYGVIFNGQIVQSYRNRNNGVDWITEIFAISGKAVTQGIAKLAIAASSEPREILNKVAENSDMTFKIGKVSDKLNNQKFPCARIIFGSVRKVIRQLTYFDDTRPVINENNKVDIVSPSDKIPANMAIHLTPQTGLIGSPVYSDDGIVIPMLLDSRVNINSLIKIDNNIIERKQANFDIDAAFSENSNLVNQNMLFDKVEEYSVAAITHEGDTYGDIWKTEVIGFSQSKGILDLQKATMS